MSSRSKIHSIERSINIILLFILILRRLTCSIDVITIFCSSSYDIKMPFSSYHIIKYHRRTSEYLRNLNAITLFFSLPLHLHFWKHWLSIRIWQINKQYNYTDDFVFCWTIIMPPFFVHIFDFDWIQDDDLAVIKLVLNMFFSPFDEWWYSRICVLNL